MTGILDNLQRFKILVTIDRKKEKMIVIIHKDFFVLLNLYVTLEVIHRKQ